jgi:hypothetical protein
MTFIILLVLAIILYKIIHKLLYDYFSSPEMMLKKALKLIEEANKKK